MLFTKLVSKSWKRYHLCLSGKKWDVHKRIYWIQVSIVVPQISFLYFWEIYDVCTTVILNHISKQVGILFWDKSSYSIFVLLVAVFYENPFFFFWHYVGISIRRLLSLYFEHVGWSMHGDYWRSMLKQLNLGGPSNRSMRKSCACMCALSRFR